MKEKSKNALFTWRLVIASIFLASSVAAQQQPNIILILADDLGYGDIGVNGQQLIRTPNIDRLAAEGLLFEQFYTGTSVCAPSRSALISGQHTGHTFIRGNLSVSPEGQYPIADSVLTIAEVLKKAGYATGAFGKWGLGPVLSDGDPNKQGFDHFFGYNCQSLAHRYYPTHLWRNEQRIVLEKNGELERREQYAPDMIQAEALAFIEEHKAKPFFLFLPHTLPHAELVVPDDSIFQSYVGKFPEEPYVGSDYGPNAKSGGYASQNYPRATFASMVARLDRYVGEVVDKLKALGLDKNTMIVFTSDNGPHQEGGADPIFFNSAGGLRGLKRDLYEGGIRVPFIVRWPETVKGGGRTQHVAAFWDLFPTFAQVAGVKSEVSGDGISFLPALKGSPLQQEHPYLYWEFHEQGGKQALRHGQWKGIRLQAATKTPRVLELYDLVSDPQEKHNVAENQPAIVRQIESWMSEAHVESSVFPFRKADTD
ncbi:arylsulfatase [Sphingobacterium griseoflavum]|uniref:Arylsulfatase n=1 Tax=Sphingobacterium griseoflavum TaxID=1474952 RepID=A0ABQ3HTR9_9SPHI|nr:arylsulfatase [Sphingobacterium griseoflavum]GHE33946.1 arylsulfatase [Sphingobacterium griseoflavum]